MALNIKSVEKQTNKNQIKNTMTGLEGVGKGKRRKSFLFFEPEFLVFFLPWRRARLDCHMS